MFSFAARLTIQPIRQGVLDREGGPIPPNGVGKKERKMAVYHTRSSTWNSSAAVGPLTEGAAGIAVIVLTILALAAISPGILTAIATIVVGVGLFIEATNTGIEYSRVGLTARTGAEMAQLRSRCFGRSAGRDCRRRAGGIGAHRGDDGDEPAAGGADRIRRRADAGRDERNQDRPNFGDRSSGAERDLGAPIWRRAAALQVLIGVAAVVLGILAYVLPTGVCFC